jgi:hypothetical protein
VGKLDSLLVDLQLNSAALRSGLDSAGRQLKAFGDTVKSIDGKLTALGQFAGVKFAKEIITGLAEFVAKGAEAANHMGKLAQSVGIPVDALSRLSYAARFSGVSTEDLGKALNKLNKKLGEAGAGAKEPAALFQALGVKVRDSNGQLRSTEAVMGDLAQAFSGFKDDAAKATLAQDLFGKAGAALIPLLNEGREGLAKWAAEADRFGITVTPAAARGAADFEDGLIRLRAVAEGLAIRVATNLAPTIAMLSDELLSSKDGTDALTGAASVLAATLRILVSGGVIVGEVFSVLGKQISAVASAIVSVTEGRFGDVLDLNAQMQGAVIEGAIETTTRLKAIWSSDDSATKALENQRKAAKTSAEGIVKTFEDLKKGVDQTLLRATSELAKDLAHIRFELSRSLASGELDFQKRDLGFGRATMSHGEQLQQDTAGFRNFEEALTRLQEATDQRARALADVQLFGARAKEARARAGDEKLTPAQRAAAEKEATAKESAAQAAQEDADALEILGARAATAADAFTEIASVSRAAKAGLRDKLLGSSIAGLGNAATEGATAFGPGGAAAGVGIELLTKSKAFGQIMTIVDHVIQQVADLFGELLVPLEPLVASLSLVVQAIATALAPAFQLMGSVLAPLTPFIVLLAMVLQGLAPVFQLVAEAFIVISMPLTFLAIQVLPKLFELLKKVAEIALSVVHSLADIWNGLITGVQGILNNIANLFGGPFQWLHDAIAAAAGALDNLKVPTAGIEAAQGALSVLTWESAKATAEGTKQTILATKAMENMNEQLTNVPEGIKLERQRFDAMAAGGNLPGIGQVNQSANGWLDSGGGSVVLNNYGTINAVDDFIKKVEAERQRRNFQRTGMVSP